MFSIEIIDDGFDKVVLKDDSSGTMAAIVPSCGGILQEFSIQRNGETFNVIDSYNDENDFKENCTGKGFKGCKLSPFVCRIKNGEYQFAGNNYKISKFYLGNNALHGLIYDVPFIITEKNAGDKFANVVLQYEYGGYDPGYPFRYGIEIRYELREQNTLSVTTIITNLDEGLIPVADGWHPYFTLGKTINELQFEFQSKEEIKFDEQLIPTGEKAGYHEFGSLAKIGERSFDNCYTLNFAECQPLCVLRNAEEGLQVEIIPDDSYPFLQIYTPPHRNSIAIENLSSVPDAFNNGMGLITLEPGHTKAFKTTYRIVRI